MHQDVQHTCNDFHDRGRRVFFALYHDFQHSVTTLNRRRDENVFQQIKGKYTQELKSRLNNLARESIQKMDTDSGRNELNHALSSIIDDYLREFELKIRSL